jgi:hypothetical protein
MVQSYSAAHPPGPWPEHNQLASGEDFSKCTRQCGQRTPEASQEDPSPCSGTIRAGADFSPPQRAAQA